MGTRFFWVWQIQLCEDGLERRIGARWCGCALFVCVSHGLEVLG